MCVWSSVLSLLPFVVSLSLFPSPLPSLFVTVSFLLLFVCLCSAVSVFFMSLRLNWKPSCLLNKYNPFLLLSLVLSLLMSVFSNALGIGGQSRCPCSSSSSAVFCCLLLLPLLLQRQLLLLLLHPLLKQLLQSRFWGVHTSAADAATLIAVTWKVFFLQRNILSVFTWGSSCPRLRV